MHHWLRGEWMPLNEGQYQIQLYCIILYCTYAQSVCILHVLSVNFCQTRTITFDWITKLYTVSLSVSVYYFISLSHYTLHFLPRILLITYRYFV